MVRRAAELRERLEPESAPLAETRPDGMPVPPPPLGVPGTAGGFWPRSLLKRAVARLTRWELVPIIGRINDIQRFLLEDLGPWTTGHLDELHSAVERQAQLRRGEHGGSARLEALYELHQERFRGSRDLIRGRQEIYLPHVRDVARQGGSVLDIGPGRGEWLELLREDGIAAHGVDLNPRFVEEAARIGLDVRHEDGVEHLRHLPEGSVAAITAFHVVEHMAVDTILDLVELSLQALRPGGLLILETPNPLNVPVGAASFLLDPTHVRPVHPLFLEFLLESCGFTRVRTLPLHPPGEPPLEVTPDLDDMIRRAAELLNRYFFVGQDYAVLGHRAAASERSEESARDARGSSGDRTAV